LQKIVAKDWPVSTAVLNGDKLDGEHAEHCSDCQAELLMEATNGVEQPGQ
jgi:hypothetical protein